MLPWDGEGKGGKDGLQRGVMDILVILIMDISAILIMVWFHRYIHIHQNW